MLDKQILTQDLQKRPLISFIVTTYNLQPELLAECLDSIMALSLSDQEREVILVDDGSDIPAIMQLTDYQNNIMYIRELLKQYSAPWHNNLHRKLSASPSCELPANQKYPCH